jgi:hypothetical protein
MLAFRASSKFVGSSGFSSSSLIMKEYEDMAIKVGDKVTMEINKVDGNGT